MSSIRVVPWSNAAQFQKVYEYLYSNEVNKMKWALDTISVWESRCHPSLPTAIEATYVLTRAVVQDILWNLDTSLVHHTDLQGIYGSAVTRFVSLCVEANKKDVLKYSIAEVAKSIGIESFIVDIRNEWCHSSRPSLSMLRKAAECALEFLKESYWKKENVRVNTYIKQPMDDETELNMLFKTFMKFYDDSIDPKQGTQSDDGINHKNPEYVTVLKRLEKCLRIDKRLFVKVLISDGIFIPFDDDLEHMLSAEECMHFSALEDDGDADKCLGICDAEILKCFPHIPKYHERLWAEIIALLNKYDAVPFFMEELLKTQGDRTDYGQKLLISWMLTILRIHTSDVFAVESCLLKKIFRRKGIIPNKLRMFHSAVINPCKYFLILLPLLTDNLDLNVDAMNSITSLAAVKLGLINKTGQKKEYYKLFHTVEDLKRDIAVKDQEREKQKKKKSKEQPTEDIWSLSPDECHKYWPIGHIINAVIDKNDQQEEEEEEIFECMKRAPDDFSSRRPDCNKNDDEDDQTCKMMVPDLNKIITDLNKIEDALY